jgi:hypothetical protein
MVLLEGLKTALKINKLQLTAYVIDTVCLTSFYLPHQYFFKKRVRFFISYS